MLEITTNAATKIQEFLQVNNITSAVRVASANGCGGPRLNLFLDEKKESDQAVDTKDGVRMIIDRELLALCGGVTVDFIESGGCGCSAGFSVTSANLLPGAGEGGCGGSCSSGSCSC